MGFWAFCQTNIHCSFFRAFESDQSLLTCVQTNWLRVDVAVLAWIVLSGLQATSAACMEWQAADCRLPTRWTDQVSPDHCWPEYPRPQLTRPAWKSLNGLWNFGVTTIDAEQPPVFADRILVPFPVESSLSGVARSVQPSERLWYGRTFRIPAGWDQQRILLHFGAVDWQTAVWVNGAAVGQHRGGYDPFSFDITESVQFDRDNQLVVAVEDPTDTGAQSRGKQRLEPFEIWYTPTSGIWQTVWIEHVPQTAVESLRITPDVSANDVKIAAVVHGGRPGDVLRVDVLDQGKVISTAKAALPEHVVAPIANPHLWSPADPHLYELRVRVQRGNQTVDEVGSYFGMRSIGMGPDQNGLTRILLNGEPLFMLGLLDQGFWPDGVYTPPTDEAMRFDLESAKQMGFNAIRKHVKVEPARWYYWCDKLGLLVWQDMPNGDERAPWPRDGTQMTRSWASAKQFHEELKGVVAHCFNAPSVVIWILFNEGWGQFDTVENTRWLKQYDPSRLVISASGGNDFGVDDIDDDHFYFFPAPSSPPAERNRAAVLGECGGLGLPVAGHTWQNEANWSYRNVRTPQQFALGYQTLMRQLRPLVETNLSAAIYTQLTDVEIEVNGLLTYDRKQTKIEPAAIRKANNELVHPVPEISDEQRSLAKTLAWWRFEEGKSGEAVPALSAQKGAVAARDVSGRRNHLYAFASETAPSIGKTHFHSSLPDYCDPSRHCLVDGKFDDLPGASRELFTDPIVSRTHMAWLDRYPFAEWTLELSCAVRVLATEQPLLTKQTNVDGNGQRQFELSVLDDGRVRLEFIDRGGHVRRLVSTTQLEPDQWYHIAAACDGEQARLYIKRDDATSVYRQEAESVVDGALAVSAGTWVVGRATGEDSASQRRHTQIDEIRISTVARPADEFLFAPK